MDHISLKCLLHSLTLMVKLVLLITSKMLKAAQLMSKPSIWSCRSSRRESELVRVLIISAHTDPAEAKSDVWHAYMRGSIVNLWHSEHQKSTEKVYFLLPSLNSHFGNTNVGGGCLDSSGSSYRFGRAINLKMPFQCYSDVLCM